VGYFAILILIGELTKDDVRQLGTSIGLSPRLYGWLERLCWRKSTPGLVPVDLSRAKGLRPTGLPEVFVGVRELPDIAPVEEGEPPPPPPGG
ncbi:MAG TPA: hypothetical protein VEE83_00940, partial [Thermoplasmata archaeon]|nr:hypothetical protein [Thermoplasmata archaeon]